jgi:hypothetical protein
MNRVEPLSGRHCGNGLEMCRKGKRVGLIGLGSIYIRGSREQREGRRRDCTSKQEQTITERHGWSRAASRVTVNVELGTQEPCWQTKSIQEMLQHCLSDASQKLQGKATKLIKRRLGTPAARVLVESPRRVVTVIHRCCRACQLETGTGFYLSARKLLLTSEKPTRKCYQQNNDQVSVSW